MSEAKGSRLIEDLGNLPEIIAALGLGIAEAQKQLNKDFVDNIGRLLQMIGETLGTAGTAPDPGTVEAMSKLLVALAPSRYQFTETTIQFYADVAERMQRQTEVAFSFGKAVMLNAGFSKAFGYDYRAAAKITSVLQAREVGAEMSKELLARAATINDTPLKLPDASTLDKALFEAVSGVYKSLTTKAG